MINDTLIAPAQDDLLAKHVRTMAQLGRAAAREEGELIDYSIGVLIEQIDLMRAAAQLAKGVLERDEQGPPRQRMTPEERYRVQQDMARNAGIITLSVKQLTETAKLADARRLADK